MSSIQETTPESFPQDLPARTTAQHKRVQLRSCYTLSFFNYYNCDGIQGHRIKARRAAMIMTLLLSTGDVLLGMVFVGYWTSIAVIVVASIVCFFEIWLVWFSLGVIGNAGDRDVTRRVCGMTLGRKFFDATLWVFFVLYAATLCLTLLVLSTFGIAIWVGVGLMLASIAFIAR